MYDRRAHALEKAILQVGVEIRDIRLWFENYFGSSGAKGTRLDISIGPITSKTKDNQMTTIQLDNTQQVNVQLSPKTAKGKPAKVDGVPTWTVQSGDSVIVVAADGMSAELISSDTDGDTVILVEADADLGAGFVPLDETITLTVSEPQAANLGLTVGTPEDKPATPPPTALAAGAKSKGTAKGKAPKKH